MNTRYVGASEIRSVSEHELDRCPDGSSAIDPLRSHLNEVLHGPRTQTEAVAQAWANGVRPPAKQAERPFVQMVLSASAEYFRDDGMSPGEWDPEKLTVWLATTMTWLKAEYGDDLAHVSLHLDEDTPHLHVLVIPTYEKAARTPGRMKRGETSEEFEERKRVAAETVTRAAGRASSPYWSRHFVRRDARKSYHAVLEPLGIGYGRDFVGEATGDRPEPKTTGKWVREQAAELRQRVAEIETRERQVSDGEGAAVRRAGIQARWDARRALRLDARAQHLADEAAALARREQLLKARERKAIAVTTALSAIANEAATGTIREEDGRIKTGHGNLLQAASPEIQPALQICLVVAEKQRQARAELDKERVAMARDREEAKSAVARANAEIREAASERSEMRAVMRELREVLAELEPFKRTIQAVKTVYSASQDVRRRVMEVLTAQERRIAGRYEGRIGASQRDADAQVLAPVDAVLRPADEPLSLPAENPLNEIQGTGPGL